MIANRVGTFLRVTLVKSSCSRHVRLLSTWTTTTATNKAVTAPFQKPNLLVGGQRRKVVNGEAAAIHAFDSPKTYPSDLVVVLDMDECLVHSQFLSAQAAQFAHQHFAHSSNPTTTRSAAVETFRITLPDGDLVHVHKRPFLERFLEVVGNKYETHVFTAAMEVYAAPVLDELDPSGTLFARRWYRDSCRFQDGAYIKDLRCLGKNPERMVLVDNNPLSFLANPENGILVTSFYNDPEDVTLEVVLELLEELEDIDDVRPILNQKFGLREALAKNDFT